jgi:hypothetical protein
MRRLFSAAILAGVLQLALIGSALAFSCYVPDKQPTAGNQGVFTGNVFTGIDLPCQTARGSQVHGAQQPEGC